MLGRVSLLCVLLCSSVLAAPSKIELIDNGYRGVLIAIADGVQEDLNLLARIKEIFNQASENMFQATGRRAYFKDVTILLPSSWSLPADTATTQTFDKANIRVDFPSGQYGDNPWVQQTQTCGAPGNFMHLTPEFITNTAASEARWGPLGKVLVHEWGHLRWGLFDEYPGSDDTVNDHFYQSPTTNTVEPTRCNIGTQGRQVNRITGQQCKIDPATSLPEADCRFFPDSIKTTSTSSYMYYNFLPTVSQFCDDDEFDPEALHNIESPSMHNRQCGGQSAWEVMRQHEDFNNGRNIAIDTLGFNTSVNFRVVQRKDTRVVLVMDISGSMANNDYFLKLNAAARRYILYTLPQGANIGLVEFSTSAALLTPSMFPVNDDITRQFLADRVPLKHSGGTAIGKGLNAGMSLLKQNGTDASGGYIVVITDGQETTPPLVSNVMPNLLAEGIIVDTVLLSPTADPVMISLAAETGGLSFYASGGDDSTSLGDAFTQIVRARQSDPFTTPITITSQAIAVATKSSSRIPIKVDQALGKDTTFTYSWTNVVEPIITLKLPNGTLHDIDRVNGSAFFICKGVCDSGTWEVTIQNPAENLTHVLLQVESTARAKPEDGQAREELLPITVTSRISNAVADFSTATKPVVVSATVARGYSPIVSAKVMASIENPSSGKVELELFDNGAGADIAKDDGTYSGYLFNTAQEGRHTVSVNVVGGAESKVKISTVTSSAGFITEPRDSFGNRQTSLKKVDEFERSNQAGFLEVSARAQASQDNFAPSRIIDLQVTSASYEEERVTLEWTAVGDDFFNGTAHKYEIYMADSFKVLYKDLRNATMISSEKILSGITNSPKVALERERFVIKVPRDNKALVFGVLVKDEEDNTSDMSNVVSARLVNTVKEEKEETSYVGLIVGVSVAVLVLCLIILAVGIAIAKGVCKSKLKSSGGKGQISVTQGYKNGAYA